MLATFRKCPRRFYEEYIHWIIPAEQNEHFVAGGAYATGHEVFRQSFYKDRLSFEDSILKGWVALVREFSLYDPPEGSSKNWIRTAGAYLQYYKEWDPRTDFIVPVLLDDEEVASEISFAHPLPEVTHPVTGDPILYGGRFDCIVTMIRGNLGALKAIPISEASNLYIYDDKTTKAMGKTWPEQWTLRSQFTGYQWGMEEMGMRVTGIIVRGLGILKEKFHCIHTETRRPQWLIDRWLEQTVRDIRRMIQCWEEDYWDYNLDDACNSYGGCPYKRLCTVRDPSPWYAAHYKKNTWNPVISEDMA